MVAKSALVTGGNRGIGLAISNRLREAGYAVITCGRSADSSGQNDSHIVADIRDPAQCAALIDAVIARNGRLDLLVNNAGGSPEAVAATASARFTERIIALNLLAPIELARLAYPHLRATGGSVVNIASVSAQRASPGTAAYAAAKAGLVAYGRSVAHEWGPEVRVNAIAVGYVETETTEATYGDTATQQAIGANIAARRLAHAREIAEAVLFLGSDAASYITGSTLNVDGGGERPPFLNIVKEAAAN